MRFKVLGLFATSFLLSLAATCPPRPNLCQGITCPPGQHCDRGVCVDDPKPPPECLPGVEWCNETNPPRVCGCKHNPSSDPNYCEETPPCPTEPPPPSTCPEQCPIGQECKDPNIGCVPKPVEPPPPTGCWSNEYEMIVIGHTATMTGVVTSAMEKVKLFSGTPRAMLDKLASQIVSDGRCAFAGQEAIFVRVIASTDIWDEFHAVYFADGITGQWIPGGKYMATHNGPAEPPPLPVGGCSSPIPPKCITYNLHAWQGKNDTTCLVYNGETQRWDGSFVSGYCASVGFVNRGHCPPRMECDDPPNPNAVKCGEREACEAIATSGKSDGKPLWKTDGQLVTYDNPFQARCTNCSWLEISNADGSSAVRCNIDKNTGLCPPVMELSAIRRKPQSKVKQ